MFCITSARVRVSRGAPGGVAAACASPRARRTRASRRAQYRRRPATGALSTGVHPPQAHSAPQRTRLKFLARLVVHHWHTRHPVAFSILIVPRCGAASRAHAGHHGHVYESLVGALPAASRRRVQAPERVVHARAGALSTGVHPPQAHYTKFFLPRDRPNPAFNAARSSASYSN